MFGYYMLYYVCILYNIVRTIVCPNNSTAVLCVWPANVGETVGCLRDNDLFVIRIFAGGYNIYDQSIFCAGKRKKDKGKNAFEGLGGWCDGGNE